MDNPKLIVEAPILDDESAVKIFDFLYDLTLSFESCYYKQLLRRSQYCDPPDGPDYLNDTQGDQRFFDDEIPF